MTARRADVTGTRLALALAAAASLALQGCTSDDGPSGPQLLRIVPLDFNVLGVAGHGSLVAVLHYGTGGTLLQVARQEATMRTELVDLGDLPVNIPLSPLDDFTVTPEWVTLSSSGFTTAVSLTTPAPDVVATFAPGKGARAIASGRWLLYAQPGDVLAVRDLESPGTGFPQVGAAMPAGAPVTGLAEALDGFYVFTIAGIGHVSMAGGVPAYRHTASEELRGLAKAFFHGTKLYAGGPSPRVGKVRVVRVDVSTPAAPALEALADVDATWGDFAYDGTGAYAVLGEVGNDYGRYAVTVLRDSGGALVAGTTQEVPIWRQAASASHASAGVLFGTAAAPYTSASGNLVMYALP